MDGICICRNIEKMNEYLSLLEQDIQRREIVDTRFGPQSTKNRYDIKSVNIIESFALIEVYMLDRQAKENDNYSRGGDIAIFTIVEGKVYSEKEWEDYVNGLEDEEPER